jgi:hypothetical protein
MDGAISEMRKLCRKFGLHMYQDPEMVGSDTFGFIVSDTKLNQKEVNTISDDMWNPLTKATLKDMASAFREAYDAGGEDTMNAEQCVVDFLQDEHGYDEGKARSYVAARIKKITKIALKD